MKSYKILAICLVAGLLLSACGQTQNSSQSEPESSSSQQSAPEEFDPLDVGVLGHTQDNGALIFQPLETDVAISQLEILPENMGKQLRVCVYDPKQQGYMVHYYDRTEQDTVGQLAQTTLGYLYQPEDGIQVASVQVEKNFGIIDLSLTSDSAAAQALTDQTAVEALLNSIGCTALKNGLSNVGFLLNGQGFSLGGITLEDDGYGRYQPADLYSQPITAQDFAGLRACLPYPGSRPTPSPFLSSNQSVLEEYPQLYTLIYYAGDTGAYDSPDQLDNQHKLAAGRLMAPDNCSVTEEGAEYPLYPADDSFLEPLLNSIEDFQFTPQEWVEQAAQTIWGPDLSLTHEDVSSYTYHPLEGVYTPPHRGGAARVEPYFHQIEETSQGYEAIVSYLTIGMGGVQDEQGQWLAVYENYLEDPQVQQLVEEKLPRYRITAQISDEGTLALVSSQLVEE